MINIAGLKVCFLAGTLGRGGAERQLLYMLRALTLAGVKARVLCLTRGEPFEDEIKALGVKVDWVGSASGSRTVKLYNLVRALRQEPPAILQSVHFYTNLYVALAARLLRIREIGAIRNNLLSELKANGIAGLGHLHLPRHLIVNSRLALERAIARGISPDRIDLVPNAVEIEVTKESQSQQARREMNILFVGRLTEQKRPDRFVRVMSRIARELPAQGIRATIVGDGLMRPKIQDLAERLGLKRLEFLGESGSLSATYHNADLLMLTSDWEGTPNVLLEAMAFGIPVVATRVGGVPEIVRENRGLLVRPDDEDGLAAAALRLLADSNLRAKLGQSGRDYVERTHSLKMLETRLTSIYQRVLSQ